jgi:signal transduction histidine kinase
MKLLSRFIWLIVAILAIVFATVALFHVRAINEFEVIKNSIRAEYDVQVDKMLQPDRYGTGFTGYMGDITNDASTVLFLMDQEPDPMFIDIYLHEDILNYNDVDAVWFFKPDFTMFHFKTASDIRQENIPFEAEALNRIATNTDLKTFYSLLNDNTIWFHLSKITDNSSTDVGFVLMASKIDERWIQKYTANINNSKINIIEAGQELPDISSQTIRTTRDFKDHENNTVAILNIELHLPFLSLWNRTNTTDKWLMTGSMIIIVLFLIIFIIIWVISPLKRISGSLSKGTSDDIEPLVKSSTELGEVARMIADYHKKTDELEASESVKRHIFEQAQVGIIIANANSGIINTTNPYACKLINAPEDAVIGNIADNFLKSLKEIPVSTEGFESILIDSTGKEVPVLRTATKMMMDGSPVIMNTFVDLSEIKILQDRLQEEKKKLSLAVQNSGLAFCEYNFASDEIIIDENWKFLTLGVKESNWKNLLNNIHESDKKTVKDKFESVLKGAKDTLVAEFRVKHPNRGIIWINISVLITRRDENRYPKQLIGLIDDITERIIVQQELIKAKEKAEESDRMKSSYLGNMSHKIRTPLNTIVGFANLLTEEELEAEQKDNFINIIRNDTEQVLHLIDDMINLAKIDANQLDINKQKISLNKIFDNLAEYYKTNEKTGNIKFSVNTMLADGKDLIVSDAPQLEKALSNLLNNAFKFTEKGEIELGYFVNPVDHKIILYVKDTGAGIPEESKDKIFNRFYQVNPLSDGTGLGLTITESIVKLIGGKITFESEPDKGSKFFVELPFN